MEEAIAAETQLYSFSVNGMKYMVASTAQNPRAMAYIVALMKNRELSGEFSDAMRLMQLDKNAHLLSIPNEMTEKFAAEMNRYNCAFSVIADASENYNYVLVADRDIGKATTIVETVLADDFDFEIKRAEEPKNEEVLKNPRTVRSQPNTESVSGTRLRTLDEPDELGRKPLSVLMADARARMPESAVPVSLEKGVLEL